MRKPSLQVVDWFYPKPDILRQRALSMRYSEPEDVIGWRSNVWHQRGVKNLIERTFRIQIEQWEDDLAVEFGNGVFFTAFSEGRRAEKLKVHFDEPADWMSLVIYLTPHAAYDTGTSFWQHRETGLIAKPTRADAQRLGSRPSELDEQIERDGWKRNCWIEIDRVGNVYNRAVMFSAGLFHSATRHFGDSLHNGRLYQSFHFPIASHNKNR